MPEDRFSKLLPNNLTLNMIVTETFKVTFDNPMVCTPKLCLKKAAGL